MDEFRRRIVWEDNKDGTVTVSFYLTPEEDPQKMLMAVDFEMLITGVNTPEVINGAASLGLTTDSVTKIPNSLDD